MPSIRPSIRRLEHFLPDKFVSLQVRRSVAWNIFYPTNLFVRCGEGVCMDSVDYSDVHECGRLCSRVAPPTILASLHRPPSASLPRVLATPARAPRRAARAPATEVRKRRCPPARLPAYPPARLPAYPPARLPACPPARLPAYPPARLPAYPPTRLPAYTRLPTHFCPEPDKNVKQALTNALLQLLVSLILTTSPTPRCAVAVDQPHKAVGNTLALCIRRRRLG